LNHISNITISDNKIWFESIDNSSDQDVSWKLDIDAICVIGFINRMNGDDDSDFLVFIDKKLKKYFLNLSKPLDGWRLVEQYLTKYFSIRFNHQVYDSELVLFPQEFNSEKLYQTSFSKSFKTLFSITHVADGELSEKIKNYILK